MVLVQVRRVASVANGLQACTSTGSGGGSSTSSQQAVETTPIADPAPGGSLVDEQLVSLYAPLPAADGTVPAACQRVSYLRWYDPAGPADSASADAILVAQPGIFEAAGAFDQVARNTVRAAAAGCHVEFWGINPRSVCLQDDTGVQAAMQDGNFLTALDYDDDGAPVNGRTFPGDVSEADAAWMAHTGLAQTVQDEDTIVSQLPPAVRQSKVLCGGHSLGGIVTAAFANWDFSGTGDPSQAGYAQCAGYFALDTRLDFSITSSLLGEPFGSALQSILSLAGQASPYIDVAPFTPETFTALPVLGMAAHDEPHQRSPLATNLPNDSNFQTTFDLTLADTDADFPCSSSVGVLVGGQCQVAPDPKSATPTGPTDDWLNYDQLPATLPVAEGATAPYTSPDEQVSDIQQLAWSLYGASPATFTVSYFPTQLVLDIASAGVGDRSGTLAGLRYTDGITRHPAASIDAGDGVTPSLGTTGAGAILAGPAPQVHVVVPGYSHLDVVTAAYTQNNGQPEQVSSTLASWAGQVVGPPAP